jgi:hypothetical protein
VLGREHAGRVAVAAAGAAVALGTFRVAGDAPKPLLLTLALAFAVIALGALVLRRTRHSCSCCGRRSRRASSARSTGRIGRAGSGTA